MCFRSIVLIQCKVLQRLKGPWSCHLCTLHDCLRCIKILKNMPAMPYVQVPMQHEDCHGCKWPWLCALHHGSHGSHTFTMKGWNKRCGQQSFLCPQEHWFFSLCEPEESSFWVFLMRPRKGLLKVCFLLSWSSCPFRDQTGWNLVTQFSITRVEPSSSNFAKWI